MEQFIKINASDTSQFFADLCLCTDNIHRFDDYSYVLKELYSKTYKGMQKYSYIDNIIHILERNIFKLEINVYEFFYICEYIYFKLLASTDFLLFLSLCLHWNKTWPRQLTAMGQDPPDTFLWFLFHVLISFFCLSGWGVELGSNASCWEERPSGAELSGRGTKWSTEWGATQENNPIFFHLRVELSY